MTVQQGLKSLAESNPNFSNQGVQNAIADTNIGFVIKTKELAYMIDINSTLTESQKSDLYDVLETQSYLNIGRYLQDLDNHTFNILNGSLGETSETDTTTPTFLEHLGAVDSIQGSYFTLYGVDASNSNKGVDDFFGTLRGTMNNNLKNIKNAVQSITAASLSEDIDYQDATQDILDFINTLGDSSTFDESTFNSLLSLFESASNNFNTILSTTYPNQRTILIENRSIIQEQITKEENNLGSIRTYSESLANLITYQGLSRNDTIRDLLSKTAQTPAWNDYFENYQTRFNQHVKDYVDLVSVAKKALRDTRLKTKINDSGKNVIQIIKESCEKLGINIAGKDVYAQSESLLNNMNNNDKEIIRQELSLHQQVNTLS